MSITAEESDGMVVPFFVLNPEKSTSQYDADFTREKKSQPRNEQ